MSELAISVTGLGKKYLLRHQRQRESRQRYVALRDVLSEGAKNLAGRLWRALSPRSKSTQAGGGERGLETEDFWALRDISFGIRQGESVGIIGRNGAGKSTLLKILSRITDPSVGRAEIHGRVASLLEVGTGFHPELTGRENIYLNGSILGMSRKEIHQKFDEIVAFAEVDRFLDTPVKRYSSGMYVRLAFAVAAHLEPDILIVDEVLAVGDVQFQSKCLGKMEQASRLGRTVLFVSHQMAAVQTLCSQAILLNSGTVECQGATGEVVDCYLNKGTKGPGVGLSERSDRLGEGRARLLAISINGQEGTDRFDVACGADVTFRIKYELRGAAQDPFFSMTFLDRKGDQVTYLNSRMVGFSFDGLPRQGVAECRVPRFPLTPATYAMDVALWDGEGCLDKVERAASLEVHLGPFYSAGDTSFYREGACLVGQEWELKTVDSAR